MLNYFKLTLGVVFALLCINCTSEDDNAVIFTQPQSQSINKILPLGASRVEGNRPDFESYRYELWKKLVEFNYTFDFIGTQKDNSTYPEFLNLAFDNDHEGRGGWTSGQILNDLDNWLTATGAPDIVLFSSPGGNDALQGLPYNNALNNINNIIEVLQNSNPNVTIFIEQMAPAVSSEMTSELTVYFNQLKTDVLSIAQEKSTSTSRIIPVNMYSGFSDDLLADDVHYNTLGAQFIAERYFNAITPFMD